MSKERTATFQDFLNGKIGVEFTWDNPAEVDEFLKLCDAKGIEWRNGKPASKHKPTRDVAAPTYRLLLEDGYIVWESLFVSRPIIPYRFLEMHDNYELHITCNDGKITHAIYKKNGETVQRSFAYRNPDDEFNFTKGAVIAMERLDDFQEALAKPEKVTPEKPDEPLWKRVKQGDKVKFKKAPTSLWNDDMHETKDKVFTVAKVINRNANTISHGLLYTVENEWCYMTDDVAEIL